MSSLPDKHALRVDALARRRNMSSHEQRICSERIIDALRNYLYERSAKTTSLLAYRAMPSEVNTEPLFHLPGYRVFAPVTHHHEHMEWRRITPQSRWRKGRFGVLEPTAGEIWTEETGGVLLCPLTAFDRCGNRLGMGKGCFDFWLSANRQHIDTVIGLAFSLQEVAEVPAESHDVPMEIVITEKGIIRCLNH